MSTTTAFSIPPVLILCFFCTCNPPHVGHVRAVQSALANVPGVEQLFVIPPRQHVWGKSTVSFAHRLNMAKLAFEPIDPKITVSDIELDPTLSGYSIDTLTLLQHMHRGKRLGMLVGADTLSVFTKWKQWQEILSTGVLIVAPRTTVDQHLRVESIPDELTPYIGERIFFLPDSQDEVALELSSTRVRQKDPTLAPDAVPESVSAYLAAHKLL